MSVPWYYGATLFGVVAVVTILSIVVQRYARSLVGFYVAGRQLTWPLLGATILATWMSMWTLMGGPGLIYKWGPWNIQLWYFGSIAGIILFTFIFGPALRRGGYLTVPDYFGDRFASNGVRAASVAVIILALFFYLVLQTTGGSILFQETLGIPYTWSCALFIAFLFVVLAISGMWSVVATDAIGMLTFMVAGVVFPIVVLWGIPKVGGAHAAILKAGAERGAKFWTMLGTSGKSWPWMIGNIIAWTAILASAPHLLSRALAAKDEKQIYKGSIMTVSLGIILTFFLFLGYVGVVKLVPLGTVRPDWLAAYVAIHILPAGIGMLYLAGAFFAGISTANAQLLVLSQGIGRDIYQQLINQKASEKRVLRVTWAGLLGIAVAALILSIIKPWLLVWVGTLCGVVLCMGFFPLLILSMFWDRVTAKAAAITLWASVPISLFIIVTNTKFGWFAPHPAIWGIIIGFAMLIILTLLTKRTPEEIERWKELKPILRPRGPTVLREKGDIWFIVIWLLVSFIGLMFISGCYLNWWGI